MTPNDYWRECISEAADECGLTMTDEQRESIAAVVQGAHENYGMAFYSPPPSDRVDTIEQEYQEKIARMERDHERDIRYAHEAMRKALKLYDDTPISIGEHGEVFRHGGRSERVQ